MNRHFFYPGMIPLDTTFLSMEKDREISLAKALEGVLGTTDAFDGFDCQPTTPASLAVQVLPGTMFSRRASDASVFGALGSDPNHQLVKEAVMLDAVTLTLVPPSTTGQAINYLIQAAFSEGDADNVVLPYFNPSNPDVSWLGPNNSGTSQPTKRKCAVVISAKPGAPATAGSQVTPAADSGYTGLWVVTVANGATTLASGNIVRHPQAPFIDYKLLDIPTDAQENKFNFLIAAGTANAMTGSLKPSVTAYRNGLGVKLVPPADVTGAATLNLNGLGAITLVPDDGIVDDGPWMKAGYVYCFIYYNGQFLPYNGYYPEKGRQIRFGSTDTGTANAVISTVSPPLSGGSYPTPTYVLFKKGVTNTGAVTANFGCGAVALKDAAGADFADGALAANTYYLAVYVGGQFRIVGGASSYTNVTNLTASSGEGIAVLVDGTINMNYPALTHDILFNDGDLLARYKVSGTSSAHHKNFTFAEFLAWLNGRITFPAGEEPIYLETNIYKVRRSTTTAFGVARKATTAEVNAGVAVTDNPYVGPEDLGKSMYGIGSMWMMAQYNSLGYPNVGNLQGLATYTGGYVTGAQLKAVMTGSGASYDGSSAQFSGPLDLSAVGDTWRFKVTFSGTISNWVPGYTGDVGPTNFYSTTVWLRRIL